MVAIRKTDSKGRSNQWLENKNGIKWWGLFRALDELDTDLIKGTFNEEFMFFDDYALQSRKEVIDHLIQGVPLEKTFGKSLKLIGG